MEGVIEVFSKPLWSFPLSSSEVMEKEEKAENPASDMAYESTIDFPLFTITDSPVKDDTEHFMDNNEKLIKKSKKERELLTIRTPGGKKDDSSF